MFDYIDMIHDKFPFVPKSDIKKILSFGLKSIYLHNMYGADTIIQDKAKNKYLFYIGRLTYDSLKHFYYYIKKMTIKIRILYNKRKIKWDGYYYFGLDEKQYNNYLSQQKGKGRKRKWFNF